MRRWFACHRKAADIETDSICFSFVVSGMILRLERAVNAQRDSSLLIVIFFLLARFFLRLFPEMRLMFFGETDV